MKKTKTLAFIAAATATLLGSCGDFEASDNGILDGFWQMTNIDTLATGHSGNVQSRMIFWSVQGGLIELSDRRTDIPDDEQRYSSIFYRFERSADVLTLLGEPKPRKKNRAKGDRDFASYAECSAYGLSDEGDVLQILRLEDKKMTLQSEHFRMYFRKY